MVPVDQRVVEADPQALGAECLDERLEQILAVGRIGRLVIGLLRVPQAEALVVLGGEHHILHARGFRGGGPVARIVQVGIEMLEVALVALVVDALVVFDPLVARRRARTSPNG